MSVQSALSNGDGVGDALSHGEAAGVVVRLSGTTLAATPGPATFVQAGAPLGVGDLVKAFLSPTIETVTPTGLGFMPSLLPLLFKALWGHFLLLAPPFKVCAFVTTTTSVKQLLQSCMAILLNNRTLSSSQIRSIPKKDCILVPRIEGG